MTETDGHVPERSTGARVRCPLCQSDRCSRFGFKCSRISYIIESKLAGTTYCSLYLVANYATIVANHATIHCLHPI